MLAMMSFVTRQYAEFTVFTGSKCFGPFSRKHTSCHSTLCASISRQRNKLAQRNKVQKEAHQMYFYAICLTQNRKCAPNGPFSQIRSQIWLSRKNCITFVTKCSLVGSTISIDFFKRFVWSTTGHAAALECSNMAACACTYTGYVRVAQKCDSVNSP